MFQILSSIKSITFELYLNFEKKKFYLLIKKCDLYARNTWKGKKYTAISMWFLLFIYAKKYKRINERLRDKTQVSSEKQNSNIESSFLGFILIS